MASMQQLTRALETGKGIQEAFAYNALVISWPEIQAAVSELKAQAANPAQMLLDDN